MCGTFLLSSIKFGPDPIEKWTSVETGEINGSNTFFTLTDAIVPGTEIIFIGSAFIPPSNYTLSANGVTLEFTGVTPQLNESISVRGLFK